MISFLFETPQEFPLVSPVQHLLALGWMALQDLRQPFWAQKYALVDWCKRWLLGVITAQAQKHGLGHPINTWSYCELFFFEFWLLNFTSCESCWKQSTSSFNPRFWCHSSRQTTRITNKSINHEYVSVKSIEPYQTPHFMGFLFVLSSSTTSFCGSPTQRPRPILGCTMGAAAIPGIIAMAPPLLFDRRRLQCGDQLRNFRCLFSHTKTKTSPGKTRNLTKDGVSLKNAEKIEIGPWRIGI